MSDHAIASKNRGRSNDGPYAAFLPPHEPENFGAKQSTIVPMSPFFSHFVAPQASAECGNLPPKYLKKQYPSAKSTLHKNFQMTVQSRKIAVR